MADDLSIPLAEQILQAPDGMWEKIRAALKVETKPEAAALVAQDEAAAALVQTILTDKQQGTALTNAKGGKSLLTSQAQAPIAKNKSTPRMEF